MTGSLLLLAMALTGLLAALLSYRSHLKTRLLVAFLAPVVIFFASYTMADIANPCANVEGECWEGLGYFVAAVGLSLAVVVGTLLGAVTRSARPRPGRGDPVSLLTWLWPAVAVALISAFAGSRTRTRLIVSSPVAGLAGGHRRRRRCRSTTTPARSASSRSRRAPCATRRRATTSSSSASPTRSRSSSAPDWARSAAAPSTGNGRSDDLAARRRSDRASPAGPPGPAPIQGGDVMTAIAVREGYEAFPALAHKDLLQQRFEVPALVRSLAAARRTAGAGGRLRPWASRSGRCGRHAGRRTSPGSSWRSPRTRRPPGRVREEGVPADVFQGDVRAMPFADGAFDVVVDFGTCFHIEGQERALAEIDRVLAPGRRVRLGDAGQPAARPSDPHARPAPALGRGARLSRASAPACCGRSGPSAEAPPADARRLRHGARPRPRAVGPPGRADGLRLERLVADAARRLGAVRRRAARAGRRVLALPADAGRRAARPGETIRLWMRGFLARYAPSGVVGYAVRARARERMGADAPMLWTATAYEQLVALLGGATVCVGAFLVAGEQPPLLAIGLLSGAVLAAVALRPAFAGRYVQRLLGTARHRDRAAAARPRARRARRRASSRAGSRPAPPPGCSSRASRPAASTTPPGSLGAFAAAWLVGFVVPGLPGGLGLRDALLAGLLARPARPGHGDRGRPRDPPGRNARRAARGGSGRSGCARGTTARPRYAGRRRTMIETILYFWPVLPWMPGSPGAAAPAGSLALARRRPGRARNRARRSPLSTPCSTSRRSGMHSSATT